MHIFKLYLQVTNLCYHKSKQVIEMAEALVLPQSTAYLHLNILEKAGLIKTDLKPARRGLQNMCACVYDQVIIALPAEREAADIEFRFPNRLPRHAELYSLEVSFEVCSQAPPRRRKEVRPSRT